MPTSIRSYLICAEVPLHGYALPVECSDLPVVESIRLAISTVAYEDVSAMPSLIPKWIPEAVAQDSNALI